MLKLKATSNGGLERRIQARLDKWAAEGRIAARLHAPNELRWWYWNEHGTRPREITPVEAKLLAFPDGAGGTALRDSVQNPGIRPHHTVFKAEDDIRNNTQLLVREALAQGGVDDPLKVREAVWKAVQEARAIIAGGLAADLPGTRPDNPSYPKQSGKLHGNTAASVFDDLAEVVNER